MRNKPKRKEFSIKIKVKPRQNKKGAKNQEKWASIIKTEANTGWSCQLT